MQSIRKLINTISELYPRPADQIPYDDTLHKASLRPIDRPPLPIEFSLTEPNTAFPVILYGEEVPGKYKILRERYTMRPVS